MKRIGRRHKTPWFFAFATLGLALALFATVQIQERIFRHHAEQMVADMRSLMLTKATWGEIQALFRRRYPPNANPFSDPCLNEDMCIVEESLSSRPSWMSRRDPDSTSTDWWGVWMQIFRLFGGRNASVTTRGILRRDHPGILIFVGAETSAHGTTDDHELRGEASSGETPSTADVWRGLALHSNYIIGRVLYPGHQDRPFAAIYVHFGPRAEAADIARLTNFDLSCLTRLLPCREPGELMPAAAAQFVKEEPQLERARKETACDSSLIPLIARSAEEALVAEVVGNLAEEQDNPLLPGMRGLSAKIHILIPKIRVIVNVDPAGRFKPDEKYGLEIFDSNTGRTVTDVPAEARPGNRLIALAQSGLSANTLLVERCGIVPMTPANLTLVQNAIAGDPPPARP